MFDRPFAQQSVVGNQGSETCALRFFFKCGAQFGDSQFRSTFWWFSVPLQRTGNKTDPSIDTVLDAPLVSWKSKFIENVVS
jgi:hypothetical protein